MTRRASFVWHACLLAALALGTAVPSSVRPDSPRRVVFRTQTMGTWASLTLVTSDSAAVADLAYESLLVLHHVDSLMSNWTETSEVARINREAARTDVVVDPEVARVLECALRVTRESQGAFDITVEPLVRLWGFLGGTPRVPSQADIDAALERTGADKLRFDEKTRTLRFAREGVAVDLGAIAKGYGADCVADALRGAGVTDALVDLSGNMVVLGRPPRRPAWIVGIRDPSGKQPYMAVVRLQDEAVATSGDYEQFVDAGGKRYGHILDPRTGWSARGLSSVTVVTDRAMAADAWATALFVLGPAAAREIASARDDLSVILVEPRENGEVLLWIEKQIRDRVDVENDYTVRTF